MAWLTCRWVGFFILRHNLSRQITQSSKESLRTFSTCQLNEAIPGDVKKQFYPPECNGARQTPYDS